PDLLSTGLAVGLVWTLASVSAIFTMAFLAAALLLRMIRRAPMPVQYGALVLAASIAAAVAFDRTISGVLGFVGGWRLVVGAAAATTIVSTWGAWRLRQARDAGDRVGSPVHLLLGTPRSITPARLGLFLAAIAAVMYGVASASRRADWDFL